MARADVRASSPALKTPRTTKTDGSGRYEFTELPAGSYMVSVSKTNFITASFGQTRPLTPGVPFDLANGQAASDVNFSLARAGVITGRVLDEFGDAVTEVQVRTMRYQYVNGERRLIPVQGATTTNDIGEFRVFGLSPGDYAVSAILRNFMVAETDDRSGYAPTYYPGTGNPGAAQRINIVPGQVVTGITFALQPVRTVKISGVALEASGKPMTNTVVMLMTRMPSFGPSGMPGRVKPDGTFTVAGVTPGDYFLQANDMMDGEPEVAVVPITVSDSDIADVQLVAARQSTMSGRVVFEGPSTPPESSTVRINLVRLDELPVSVPTVLVKDDLTFEIKAAAGRSLVRTQPTGDWRLKRVLQNGEDVTDSGIDVPANSTLSNVVVELTTTYAEISGSVIGEDGKAKRDAWVIVFAQDAGRWTRQTRYVLASRPVQNDEFHARVPAGDYFAVALEENEVELGQWTDPDFLSRLRDRAVRVSIADGAKTSLALKVSSSR